MTDPIRNSEHAESVNHAAPLPSPSRRLHDLTMAMATRSVAAKVESVTVKMATVGDLKGQYVLEGLTLIRDEDDTLSDFVTKLRVALAAVHGGLAVMNTDDYRDEAMRASLAETRGGAS